jgi:hypothetical protein
MFKIAGVLAAIAGVASLGVALDGTGLKHQFRRSRRCLDKAAGFGVA